MKHLAESRSPGEPSQYVKYNLPCIRFKSSYSCVCVCVCVCAISYPLPHTQRSPEAVIYPSLSLFIFLPLPHPSVHPCRSTVWPQINRVHSDTLSNHIQLLATEKSSGEPCPLQLQNGTHEASAATRARVHTHEHMTMISWISADS